MSFATGSSQPAEEASMKLADRVAIVPGAAQGIGRAVAQKLADELAKP